MKINCAALICSILLLSCGDNNSKEDIIPEEQFINLYADALILKEENNLSLSDSLQVKHSLDSLYASYNVTSVQYDATLQYYKKDLPRWKKLYGDVVKRLEFVQIEQRQKAKE